MEQIIIFNQNLNTLEKVYKSMEQIFIFNLNLKSLEKRSIYIIQIHETNYHSRSPHQKKNTGKKNNLEIRGRETAGPK